jgi:hypothetical protein
MPDWTIAGVGQLETDKKSDKGPSLVICGSPSEPSTNEISGDNLPKSNGTLDRGTQGTESRAPGSGKVPAGVAEDKHLQNKPPSSPNTPESVGPYDFWGDEWRASPKPAIVATYKKVKDIFVRV